MNILVKSEHLSLSLFLSLSLSPYFSRKFATPIGSDKEATKLESPILSRDRDRL